MSQHDTLTARLDRIASWLRNPANTDGCEALELSFAEWCKTVEEAIAALSATQPAQAAQSDGEDTPEHKAYRRGFGHGHDMGRVSAEQAIESDGRGTDAQIEKERDIARHAIVGSLAAGYAGQAHPGTDHWLAAAHEAGARIKELEAQAVQPSSEDVRELSKWLNEGNTSPINRQALARVLHAAQGAQGEPEGVEYFAYSDEMGFETFKTRDEAIICAQESITIARSEARHDGEWSDDVSTIRWGVTIAKAQEVELDVHEPGDPPCVDYVLTASTTPPAQPAVAQGAGEVVAAENERLRTALRFYARGEHFNTDDEDDFDTVSGEPANWLHSGRDGSTTMIEDGSIACFALRGKAIKWIDDDEDSTPQPIDGEAYTHPTPAQPAPVVPEGWKLVPMKCDEAMKDVGIQFEFATVADGRLLAQTMWSELLAATPTPPAQAAADARDAFEVERLTSAISKAYGYLWCVNNEPGTPNQYPPERAAYEARKVLRDLLTHEQRGIAINAAVQAIDAALATHQQRQDGGEGK